MSSPHVHSDPQAWSDSQVWKMFEALNPASAARIACQEVDEDRLRYVKTELNEDNLFDSRSKNAKYFHSQAGAFQEAKEWVFSALQGIDDRLEVLVVYGIGMGWYWRSLLPWLERKKERRVIFVEDDLEVVSCFLKSENAAHFFLHPQTSLVTVQDVQDKESFDLLTWNLFRRKWKWLVCPVYMQYRPKASQMLSDSLYVAFSDLELVADEFSTFGIAHARNLLRNILFLQQSKNGADLFGRFKGMPAIVVAAGPSLQEAIPFIQSMSDKALILSGGSSTNALLESGVVPHMAATVDPNPLQYSRLKYLEPFALPLFFRSRALYEGVQASGASSLLYLKGGDGYPLVSYFENSLGIDGPAIDGGDSVSSLLIELAVSLGAKNIIMVGYDLAYTDGKRYSAALEKTLHESEKLEYIKNGGSHTTSGSRADSSIEALSNSGDSVFTESKWVTEAKWISRYYSCISDEITLVNTASRGMAIDGVPFQPLHEVEKNWPVVEGASVQGLHPLQRVLTEMSALSCMKERVNNKTIPEAMKALSEEIAVLEKEFVALKDKLKELSFEVAMADAEVIERLNTIQEAFAMKWLFQPFWQMHEKWMMMRKKLDFKSSADSSLEEGEWGSDEELQFEKRSLLERVDFLLEGIATYKKLFFSSVSWAALQGHFYSDPFDAAPWPDSMSHLDAPNLSTV